MKAGMILAAALIAAPVAFVGEPAIAAIFQAGALPGVDASGVSRPLAPAQLTAEEKVAYSKLKPGSEDARRFLYSRGFLRYAQLVVAKKLDAAKLPELPERKDWDEIKFFSKAERQTIDAALSQKIALSLKPNIPPSPPLVLLAPDRLTADERATFAKLAPGSPEARRFLHTRSFLRPCQQVIDGKLDPLQLPSLPEDADWDRRYFSETESKRVIDVCLGMSIVAMMK